MTNLVVWDAEQLIDSCVEGKLVQIQNVIIKYPHLINTGLNYTSDTLLHIAVLKNQIPIIEYLLSCPEININAQNEYGVTALHFAAEKESTAIVDILLANPFIDVNIQDEEGKTPLHQASLCGIVESVEKLISREDIDVTITNNNGKTALDVCGGNCYDWICNDKPKRIITIKALFGRKIGGAGSQRSSSARSFDLTSPRTPSIFTDLSSLESTNSRSFFVTPRSEGFSSQAPKLPSSAENPPPVVPETEKAKIIQQLSTVLQKKTCAWNRSKIMIVGPGRAGKTALARSILGEPFQKDLVSTIGINQFSCEVKHTGLSSDGHWEKYSEPKKLLEEAIAKEIYRMNHARTTPFQNTMINATGNSLGRKLSFKKSWSKLPSTGAAIEKFPPMKPGTVFNFAEFKAASVDSEDDDEEDGFRNKESSSLSAVGTAGNNNHTPSIQDVNDEIVMECLSKGIHLFDSKYIFSVYDFGGQSIFDVIHPFFLSRYGVYIIVFNMKDFYSSTPEKLDSCFLQLRFWMNSIAIHSQDQKTNEMAPILFVGTRKDIIKDPSNHEQISNQLYSSFQNHNAWPFVVPNDTGEGEEGSTTLWFFPVDNTQGRNDATVQKLMVSVEEVVSESSYINEEIPFLWLSIIDELKSFPKSFITYPDMIRLITSKKYQLKESMLTSLLAFLHQMGILMWYDEDHLRNIIILDPIDYFVKPVTLIICKHSITSNDSTLHMTPAHKKSMKHFFEDWQCMVKYGIITESLLKALLNSYDYKDNIIYLMGKFGLLLPLYSIWKAKSFHLINNNRTYLVPSLLPELPLYAEDLLTATTAAASAGGGWREASLAHKPSTIEEEGGEEDEDDQIKTVQQKTLETVHMHPFLYSQSSVASTTSHASSSTPLYSPSNSIASSIVFYFGFHLSAILKNKTIITTTMMKECGFLPNGFFERLLCKIIPSCIEDEVHLEDKNISEHIFRNAISYLSYKGQEFHIYCLVRENMLKVEIINGLNPIPIYLMLQKNLSIICKESYGNLQICTLLEFPFLSVTASGGLSRGRSTSNTNTNGMIGFPPPVPLPPPPPPSNWSELIFIKLSTVEKCLKYNRDLEISFMELQSLGSFSPAHLQNNNNNTVLLSPRPRSLPPSRPSSSSFQHKEKISISSLKTEYNVWLYQYKQRLMLTNYDVFLSYRWNNADSELVKSLFLHFLYYNLSNHIYSPISVFLDHQRIQAGEEFREIFVSALLKSRVIIPIITIEALKGMIAHVPEKIDNLLLEWILSLACYYYDDNPSTAKASSSTSSMTNNSQPVTPSRMLQGSGGGGGGGNKAASEQKRKILPIIMGSYEIDETTKEITKLTKIHDPQEIQLSPTEIYPKETILTLLRERTQSLYPTETMNYAKQLFERNGMQFSEEIQRFSVYQIIDKLLLFQGIIVTNQLYQFPLKLEILTKEYVEKIMESVYSIYGYYEENDHLGGGGGGNVGGGGTDHFLPSEANERDKDELGAAMSPFGGVGASSPFLKSNSRTTRIDRRDVEQHIRSIIHVRNYMRWDDYYFYNAMHLATIASSSCALASSQSALSLQKQGSISKSQSYSSNSGASSPIPSLQRMNGSIKLSASSTSQADFPSPPITTRGNIALNSLNIKGSSPNYSKFSKIANSESADSIEGTIRRNISEDSVLGDHSPTITMKGKTEAKDSGITLRLPLAVDQIPIESNVVPEVTAASSKISSLSIPPPRPLSIVLPLPPTVAAIPPAISPPEATSIVVSNQQTATVTDDSISFGGDNRIDASFAQFIQEIEHCQQNHIPTMKYFQYRQCFLQKNFTRAKEIQIEIKDYKCCYKTKEEYERYLQHLLHRIENDFESQYEQLALDEPKYFDDYLLLLQWKESIQQLFMTLQQS